MHYYINNNNNNLSGLVFSTGHVDCTIVKCTKICKTLNSENMKNSIHVTIEPFINNMNNRGRTYPAFSRPENFSVLVSSYGKIPS